MKTRYVTPEELEQIKNGFDSDGNAYYWRYNSLDSKINKNMPKDCVGIYKNEYIVVESSSNS